MEQKSHKALVTLAVGDDYVRSFVATASHTWNEYCNRHGYDLVMLTEPIDKSCDFSQKSIHWQKLLIGMVPQLRDYDWLVWVDGDILINYRQAPCIVSHMKEDKIGVVDASDDFHYADDVFNLHTRYLLLNACMARQLTGGPEKIIATDGDLREYHRMFGFTGEAGRFINTGVLVFNPRRHADWLAEIYAKYPRNFYDFENTPLSYEMQVADRAEYLDRRFNLAWAHEVARNYPFLFNLEILKRNPEMLFLCANAAFRNSWFLHFAGAKKNPIIKEPFKMIAQDAESMMQILFPDDWAGREANMRFCPLKDIQDVRAALGDDAKAWTIMF
ncbi:MAG: hypothetical protein H7841_13860 [Magnetospirillum sp. WYHS-4]